MTLDRSSTLLTSIKKHITQGSPNGGPLLCVSSVIYRMNGKFDEHSSTFFKMVIEQSRDHDRTETLFFACFWE